MKTLLFVEDELDILEIYSELLAPHFKISCCEDSVRAKELIEQNSYDILLTDYNLGEVNGIELCELFKEKNDKPTILFTGSFFKEGKIGNVDVLVEKPCQYEVLLKVIKRLTDG